MGNARSSSGGWVRSQRGRRCGAGAGDPALQSDEERSSGPRGWVSGPCSARLFTRRALTELRACFSSQLMELQVPPGLTTADEAVDMRKEAADFWKVTGTGLLEDGNTNTLGAKKPQTLARLVQQLHSFTVRTPEQMKSLHRYAQRLVVAHRMNEAVRIEQDISVMKKKTGATALRVNGRALAQTAPRPRPLHQHPDPAQPLPFTRLASESNGTGSAATLRSSTTQALS